MINFEDGITGYFWRDAIADRDNYRCKICGSKEGIEAHHIFPQRDYPEWSEDINNGIALCSECHKKTVWKEYEFVVMFQDIIGLIESNYLVVKATYLKLPSMDRKEFLRIPNHKDTYLFRTYDKNTRFA